MVTRELTLCNLIDDYLLCCSTEGKSRKTIEFYSANLKRFNRFLAKLPAALPISELGPPEARSFLSYLQNDAKRWEDNPCVVAGGHLSAHSVHGYARTLKAFWSWLFAEGYLSENRMTKLKLPKVPKKVVATFTTEQIQRLFGVINLRASSGFRDYVMILVLLDTGIRLSELINIDRSSIEFEQSCFRVTGKGSKERIVPFGIQVKRALLKYITQVRPEPYCAGLNLLFLTDKGWPLMPRAVQSMISRLGEKATIHGVRCSPHTFRHTFARQYLMNGGDVFSLQRILGHSSLEMVKIYVNLAFGDIAEQHRKYSPVDNWVAEMRGKFR
jgi:integrase/recombinase XerD